MRVIDNFVKHDIDLSIVVCYQLSPNLFNHGFLLLLVEFRQFIKKLQMYFHWVVIRARHVVRVFLSAKARASLVRQGQIVLDLVTVMLNFSLK